MTATKSKPEGKAKSDVEIIRAHQARKKKRRPKKPKGKPIEAALIFTTIDEKLLEQGWRKFWPSRPFKEGELCKIYDPGCYPKYGVKAEPDAETLAFVQKVLGKPLTLANLRIFLESECNHHHLEDWGWTEILAALVNHHEKRPEKHAGPANGGNGGTNRVDFAENNLDFIENKKAIEMAHKIANNNEDIDSDTVNRLKKMGYDYLKKLLRRSEGRAIRYMSRPAEKGVRPAGKVHKQGWASYLQNQIQRARDTEVRIEQAVREVDETFKQLS